MENSDWPAGYTDLGLLVKREPDTCTSATHSEAIDQLTTINLELATPEDSCTGCHGPSCSWNVDDKQEVGIEEPVGSKSGRKWEGSKYVDEGESIHIPWQVYKDGELISHIWDVDSQNESSKMNPVDGTSSLEQPVKPPMHGDKTTFEETMRTINMKSGLKSSPVVDQAMKPVTIAEATASDLRQVLYCEICKLSFKDSYFAENHMKNHSGEKRHRCTECEYSTSMKGNLTTHMITHTGGTPLRCTVCEFRCAHKNSMSRHMKTHTGEKPFTCTICEYRCTENSSLIKHTRTHTGQKPFECSVCDYRCKVKSSLTQHMRRHTGEKPFLCPVCGYRSAVKSTLIQHMRTHTGEKPFKCSVCDYRCTVMSNLYKHIRKKHIQMSSV